MNKKRHLYSLLLFLVLLVIFDQVFKIFIKTHFLIGESVGVCGRWFMLHFIENDGMAYGLKFSEGRWAKIFLSLFRLLAISYGFYYVVKEVLPRNNKVLNYLVFLILAGSIGNLLDSLFYGLIFTESGNVYDIDSTCAKFSFSHSYGKFLEGKVVDMLYFPVIKTTLPSWIPFMGGKYFEFFSPIFNLADAFISSGMIAILVFRKKIFKNWNKCELKTNT